MDRITVTARNPISIPATARGRRRQRWRRKRNRLLERFVEFLVNETEMRNEIYERTRQHMENLYLYGVAEIDLRQPTVAPITLD